MDYLIYIDQPVNHLNDTKWEQVHQAHHCSSKRSIKISKNKNNIHNWNMINEFQ